MESFWAMQDKKNEELNGVYLFGTWHPDITGYFTKMILAITDAQAVIKEPGHSLWSLGSPP